MQSTAIPHGHDALAADGAIVRIREVGMWRSLKAAPLLTGYRGGPPVHTAAVEDLVLRLGRLAEELPEVAGPDGWSRWT